MSKHTAAPWSILQYTPTIVVIGAGSNPKPGYAKYKDGSTQNLANVPAADEEGKANARLIAAAPEMLVEIERYLSIAKREGWHSTVSVLEKLIMKARSES